MNRTTIMAVAAAVLLIGGCAPRLLSARVPEPELRSRLDTNFPMGLTRAQVESKLDDLDVSRKYRHWYQSDPPQLLVRLFETGGFWLEHEDDHVKWVDVVFAFRDDSLAQIGTFPGGNRYFRGDPMGPLPYETLYPQGRFPIPPPPPAQPWIRSLP